MPIPGKLVDAVGVGCANHVADVRLIKQLLNACAGSIGLNPPLDINNPHCGPSTIAAIKAFQRIVVGNPQATGRIRPGGPTIKALIRVASAAASSGTSQEWAGDSSRWSQDKKLKSMNPQFRQKVERVLVALRKSGFQPSIVYGWRSVAVQLELVKKGRSKVKFSFHNAQTKDGTPNAYAADIIDVRWSWSAAAESNGFWKALGKEANAVGSVWGGDWVTFRDWAHIQHYPNSSLAQVKRESGK